VPIPLFLLFPSRLSTLSDAIHVPCQRINEIINKKRGITPSTALRLTKYFGISADFWLNLQMRWDVSRSSQSEFEELETIKPPAT